MPFDSISQIQDALRSKNLKAGDLHECWEQRRPVRDPAREKEDAKVSEAKRQLDWIGDDLRLVHRFTARALDKDEFLLVCDAASEVLRLEDQANEDDRTTLVKIRMDYAQALTRLGFTRRARTLLEPCIAESFRPRLGKLKVDILLQIGDILKEESHHAPSQTDRLQIAEEALAAYQHALELDPTRLEALLLSAAAGLITSAPKSARRNQALERARQTLGEVAKLEEMDGPRVRTSTARAFALATLGRLDEAAAAFSALEEVHGVTTEVLSEARHHAQYLAEAQGLPRQYFNPAFPPLQLIVFAGHMPDRPGEKLRFPPEAIDPVRDLLRKKLAEAKVRVGLVGAAAGADLLFFEALKERGATTHIVLPWEREEFRRTSVQPFEHPGSTVWNDLFDRALLEADTLREEGHLFEPSSPVGKDYLTEVIAGMAFNTGRTSRLDVQPMVLWDGRPGGGPGGTQAFADFWRAQLQIDPIVIEMPQFVPPPPHMILRGTRCETPTLHQEVKSMIFADIVGYSKLTEKVIPEFINTFLERLSQLVAKSKHQPRSVNTWGDAIYAVFDYAHDAGCFALELVEMVQDGKKDWLSKGLYWQEKIPGSEELISKPLNIRVGLHTGPVFLHYDPVVRRLGYTGAHVNRAARIEPVAQPGEIFASEEFAALAELDAEIGSRHPQKGHSQNVAGFGFVCEYAGTLQLAKNFPGRHRIYRVLPKRAFALEELAQAAHKDYCEKAVLRGDTPESHPAIAPWDSLPEDLREANRAQVAHIPWKLAKLGYELAPGHGLHASEIKITDAQLEELAMAEHDRWMAERMRQGWTFAKMRDNARKHHPLLVPWDDLNDIEKDKDRDTVRNMPGLIELAGFRIRPLPKRK